MEQKYLLKPNETMRPSVISEKQYYSLSRKQKRYYELAPVGWNEPMLNSEPEVKGSDTRNDDSKSEPR